jgi:hypothetical protein
MTMPAAVSPEERGGVMRAHIVVLASLVAAVAAPAAQPKQPIVQEPRSFATITNIMRAQHEIAKVAISNMR